MEHRKRIRSRSKFVYIIILTAGVLMSLTILYSLFIGLKLNFAYSELLDNSYGIKANIADARYELLLSRQDNSDVHLRKSWEYLDAAGVYSQKLTSYEDPLLILSSPLENLIIKKNVNRLNTLLLEYREFSNIYINKNSTQQDSEEKLFQSILSITNEIDAGIQSLLNIYEKRFRVIQFLLSGFAILLCFIGIFLYFIYDSQRIKFTKQIQNVTTDFERGLHKSTKIEKQLSEIERKYNTLLQNLPGAVYRCKNDSNWTMEYISDKCFEITGYKAGDIIDNKNISYAEIIYEEDRRRVWNEIQEANERRKPFQTTYRIKTESGIEKWIWEQGKGIFTENDDELNAIEGFITDVSDQKAIEDQLYLQSKVLEVAANSIIITDLESNILWANKAFSDLTGYPLNEIIGKKTNILKSGEHHQSFYAFLWKTILAGEMWRGEILNKRKDGSHYHEEMVITPVKNDKGEVKYFVAIKEDITERKNAERELINSELRFRSLYENATIGIYRVSADGDLQIANPTLIKLLGYDSFEDLKSADTGSHYVDVEAKTFFRNTLYEKGRIFGFESEWHKKDGTIISIRESARLIKDSEGRIVCYDGTIEDITEKKLTEKELIISKEKAELSDKLKSEFLAQMSHEIRTPLNVILSFINMMKDELQHVVDEELLNGLDVMETEGKRIMRTIELIVNMSELQTGQYQLNTRDFDLWNEVVIKYKNYYEVIANQKQIKLEVINNAKETTITGDFYSIDQIILHLLDNAVKFTNEGVVRIVLNKDPRGNLYIDFADTGIGISEQYMKMLFTPFTREEMGYTRNFEGNGLGLALIKRYCDLNNAEIKVSSKKGQGSLFRVTFKNS